MGKQQKRKGDLLLPLYTFQHLFASALIIVTLNSGSQLQFSRIFKFNCLLDTPIISIYQNYSFLLKIVVFSDFFVSFLESVQTAKAAAFPSTILLLE